MVPLINKEGPCPNKSSGPQTHKNEKAPPFLVGKRWLQAPQIHERGTKTGKEKSFKTSIASPMGQGGANRS